MKNNTKIRLHLSKNLFETIAKEVLAEAKKKDMSGGVYTEMVKQPKSTKAEKDSPEVKATDKMKKIHETKPKHDKDALMKAKAMLEKRLAEMEINVAEEEE